MPRVGLAPSTTPRSTIAVRFVSKILRKSVREVDLASSYGSEQLLAILPRTPLAIAAQAAERVRTKSPIRQ
jgi:PleD family two-component response regulator